MYKSRLADTSSLHGIYNALLGRDADLAAITAWDGSLCLSEVIERVTASDEFKGNLGHLLSVSRRAGDRQYVLDTNSFYRIVGSGLPSQSDIEKIITTHCFGGEYWEFHKKRFLELHTFVSRLRKHRKIRRVLDISTMPFTTSIFRHYIEDVEVVTIDLPKSMGGPEVEQLNRWNVSKHVATDLNLANFDELFELVTERGAFDLIVAGEVIEHLQRDFAEIASFILKCLSEDGLGYVSTPNYLASWRMRVLAEGGNPQQRFRNFRGNMGGHYHYREYTMQELVGDVKSVGAHVSGQIYSNCYAYDRDFLSERDFDVRDNVIVLFGKSAKDVFSE